MVQKAKILFPLSQIGAIDTSQRSQLIKSSRIYGKYDTPVDRESAFEVLLAQARKDEEEAAAEAQAKETEKKSAKGGGLFGKLAKAVFTAVTASVAASVGTAVSNKVAGGKPPKTKKRKHRQQGGEERHFGGHPHRDQGTEPLHTRESDQITNNKSK